jgi:hypothetical protein
MSYWKLVWDWDSFKGTVGAIAAVVLPLMKTLTPVLQFFGALGGVLLLFYSVRHKRLEYKKLKGEK